MTERLVARTRRLDVEPDLVACCGDDGLLVSSPDHGVLGHGVSLRIPLDRSTEGVAARVASVLEEIDVEDELDVAGTGAVAFGALPFRPDAPGELVVPRIVVGRRADGDAWVTTIGPGHDEPTAAEVDAVLDRAGSTARGFARDAGLHAAEEAPTSFDVRPLRDPAEWCADVAEVTRRIRAGRADKVVLARGIEIRTDRPIRVGSVLSHLRRSFPGSHLFSIEGFVGASPEMLVEREGPTVRAHPMAGTAPRSGDADADARLAAALLASTNTRDEHRRTIDMVHDTLLPWCSWLDEDAEPRVVAVANVQHLATRLVGHLTDPTTSVLELVAALHPTPAVGGAPRQVALDTIAELERLDRGRYAGPVGWVDGAGNGRWIVGIRSATIGATGAVACAGVGVVADSDPEAELAETRAKLQAILGAVLRP
jgi:menaquinone-specific isochorismate synthase